MDQVKTGALIRALRTQKGLTQKALAEAVGVVSADEMREIEDKRENKFIG